MKSNSRLALIALLILCLTLSGAGWAICQHQQAKRALAAHHELESILGTEIHSAEIKVAQVRQEHDRRLAALPKAKADPRPPGPGMAPNARAAALVVKSPKLLDLYLRTFQASLPQRYGSLYLKLGLTPEQIEEFESLMAKHEESRMDLLVAADSKGLGNADPSVTALRKQQDEQLRTAQTALLGPDGYEQLHQLNREQGARLLVNAVAGNTLDTAPYTEAQASQLAQIVAAASTTYQQGGPFNPKTVDWENATGQAGAILSPPQLDAFKVVAQSMKLYTMLDRYYSQSPSK